MFVQGHIQMNTCTAEEPYEYLLDSGASLSGVISEALISNHTGVQQMGVFTVEGCRFYPIQANKDVLKILSDRPRTLQGLAKQGVYVYSANPSKSN